MARVGYLSLDGGFAKLRFEEYGLGAVGDVGL